MKLLGALLGILCLVIGLILSFTTYGVSDLQAIMLGMFVCTAAICFAIAEKDND